MARAPSSPGVLLIGKPREWIVYYRYVTDLDSVRIDETAAKEGSQQIVASLCWTNAQSVDASSAGAQTGSPTAQDTPTSALLQVLLVVSDHGISEKPHHGWMSGVVLGV